MTAKIAAALLFLALNGYVYWYLGSAEVIPPRAEFSLFPDQLEGRAAPLVRRSTTRRSTT